MKQQMLILLIVLVTTLLLTGCETDLDAESDSSHSTHITGLFKTSSSKYLFSIGTGMFMLLDLSGDDIRGTGGDFDQTYVTSDDADFSGWYAGDGEKIRFSGKVEFSSDSEYSLTFDQNLDQETFVKIKHTQLLALTTTEIDDEVGCFAKEGSPLFEYDTRSSATATGFTFTCNGPSAVEQAIGFTLGEYTYIFKFGNSENELFAVRTNNQSAVDAVR